MAAHCQDKVLLQGATTRIISTVCSPGMLNPEVLKVTGLFSKALACIARVRALVWAVGATGDIRACQAGIHSIQSAELRMPCEIPHTSANQPTQMEGYCEN